MPPELQELLRPRVERLGYLGEFFQRAGHQPEALTHFYRWTETLKDVLPFRLVEVVALTVATKTGNDYERVQHERLALQGGMAQAEIDALKAMRPGACHTLADQEIAAATLARCALDDTGRGCNPALLRLSRLIGEPGAVGCLMLIGRYVAHATMANAWNLRVPESVSTTDGSNT